MGAWLQKLFSSSDEASVKRVAYLLVIAFACGWLTWDVNLRGIRPDWMMAFVALLGATTTGYIAGKRQEPQP